MSTEIEELVQFLHHGNAQIRQVATETLASYSEDASIFKTDGLRPVQDLKLLIRDNAAIAHHALTILVNISSDADVLANLAQDDVFVETLLARLVDAKEPNADDLAMLLANMTKSPSLERLLKVYLKPSTVSSRPSSSPLAIYQLLECFEKGNDSQATFDYLAYVFADLAQYPAGMTYFTSRRQHDGQYPLSKLLPYLQHASLPRRLGVALTLKNLALNPSTHAALLEPLSVVPMLLRPLISAEDSYSESERAELPSEVRSLDPACRRDEENAILIACLETLLLLTTRKAGRDLLRKSGTYYVVRECHKAVKSEEVAAVCYPLVEILIRDDAPGMEHEEQAVGPSTGEVDLVSAEKDKQ